MPLFDYRCAECRSRFTLLVGVVAERQEEKCPHCGGTKISRLISRFARLRSDDDLIEDLADPAKAGDLEDPKQVQSWMKRMGKEMGDDLGGDFDDLMKDTESPSDKV